MPSGFVRARTWQAKPLSQQQQEAETARLYDRDDYLRQRIKDDRHLLHQTERLRLRNISNGYNRLPGVGYGYGGLRTPMPGSSGIELGGSPLINGVGFPRRRMSMMDGLAGRQALGADLVLREAQKNAILIREQNLAQERNLLRMRQMEDQAYLRSQATINSYGLSPRLGAFDGSMLDPYQLPALNSPYMGVDRSPYGASHPYLGSSYLDNDPLASSYGSPYMHELAYLDVPMTTPGRVGLGAATPRMAMIDPPLF